jgi:nitrogen fixation/metabolism regulation signal transduction histidine kinase
MDSSWVALFQDLVQLADAEQAALVAIQKSVLLNLIKNAAEAIDHARLAPQRRTIEETATALGTAGTGYDWLAVAGHAFAHGALKG